jgi:2,4-dienoyl-CoA reductase-like NADH-dependent reductase (Old Yellow Enzyme family)
MESRSETAFAPGRLGALDLDDRILGAATFEGLSPNGVPGARLARCHREVAEGGVAMTAIAHCSTEAAVRIREQMLYRHEGIEPELPGLVSEVQAARARVFGQINPLPAERRLRGGRRRRSHARVRR